MDAPRTRTLAEILRDAREGAIIDGWIYHSTEFPFGASSPCLIVTGDDLEYDDDDLPLVAKELGFTTEGLEGGSIESTATWCEQFLDPPSDDLLVESYNYYWRWDAFLPEPGAPDPPSAKESQRRIDLEFYSSLGEERSEVRCREVGCNRGAVRLSVLCRKHHFENVMRRPCLFEE